MASKCLTPTTGKNFQLIHRYSTNLLIVWFSGWESLMDQQLVLLSLKISSQERKSIDLITNVFLSGLFTRAVRLHMDTSKSSTTVLPSTPMHLFWRILLGRPLFLSDSALFKAPVEALWLLVSMLYALSMLTNYFLKDTVRDVRGFAIKFYTDEGIWDLVGNNIPVFFIQDAIKFPDVIHAVKPEPQNEVPQGQSAHNNFWDFVGLQPECIWFVHPSLVCTKWSFF